METLLEDVSVLVVEDDTAGDIDEVQNQHKEKDQEISDEEMDVGDDPIQSKPEEDLKETEDNKVANSKEGNTKKGKGIYRASRYKISLCGKSFGKREYA